jgi:3-hydroxybutyryl-CoA dehydrogenase
MNFDKIHTVAIVGAGTMGAGMGLCFAQAGYNVTLYSRTAEGVDRATARIQHSQDLFVQEGLSSTRLAEETKSRIRFTTQLHDCLKVAQFVLESVPEKLELKQRLFRHMESVCPSDAILATNTSGLSITAIASVCQHPERIGGMHWANPAEIVPLVEVIRGQRTSDHTLRVIYEMAEALGKVPVVINKEIPGFASNRLQFAILREALHLVEAGVVSPQDLDRTLKCGVGFRYPWLGPLETADLGGLDVFHSISEYLFKELSAMSAPPGFFSQIVKEGKLGIKTGRGFYDYQDGAREKILRQRDLYFVRQLKLIREIQQQDA